jgi:hypothetical protein
MWKQKLKKLIDNPVVVFYYLRNKLWYRFIADKTSAEYSTTQFLSGKETLDEILRKDTSIIRAGDGTMGYLLGSSIYFNNWQFRYNRAFAKKLDKVMRYGQDSNILFCYPHSFIKKTKAEFESENIGNEWRIWVALKVLLKRYLRSDKKYGDATCFHPRYNTAMNFLEIKNYLDSKHVIIITSGTERFKDIQLGKSTHFVEGPASDAWQVYESLEQAGLKIISENNLPKNEVLFMISAAEAAKVMVYDLTKQGYTAWDTGQFFDMAAKEIAALGS